MIVTGDTSKGQREDPPASLRPLSSSRLPHQNTTNIQRNGSIGPPPKHADAVSWLTLPVGLPASLPQHPPSVAPQRNPPDRTTSANVDAAEAPPQHQKPSSVTRLSLAHTAAQQTAHALNEIPQPTHTIGAVLG
jgi:hypothetical protein